jgi:hypothetical protein
MNKAKYLKRDLSDPDLSTKAQTAQTSLDGNANFPGAEMLALLADFQNRRDNYGAALAASIFGGRAAKQLKNTCRRLLFNSGKPLVDEVNRIADGDRDKLSTCGLEIGSEVAEKKTMEPLRSFKVFNGINLGEIIAKARAGRGTKFVLFEYGIGDTIESITAWTSCPASKNQCTITGLSSGKRIWVRAISVGARDQRILATAITTIIL